MYDAQHLEQLRLEAKLNSIDFTRGHIREARDGGYTVTFDKPLFDCAPLLASDDVPTERDARTGGDAEFQLLTGLLLIQRGERQKLRIGRCFGLSGDQISRRPLTEAEVDEYRAEVAHRAQVAKLQKELAAVLESNAVAATTAAGATDLAARYGLAPATNPTKPTKAVPVQGSAKRERNPSRTGATSK
ncbi:hypothetical protein [Pseudomonas sp. MPC6]|uniref:hypothetical protein n=1 Tax=unclassified Pseudomonas TaxID=196821 RepID=UPI001110A318|nr:hypothetical protein [Pseudomonas sp. MPC6]QCY11123.1 hypothetical protein ELQ88_10015 [Pseudomonas sp. MPC6]